MPAAVVAGQRAVRQRQHALGGHGETGDLGGREGGIRYGIEGRATIDTDEQAVAAGR